MGTCFFYKNTEQNGPLVLKWNQLFRVPNSERNRDWTLMDDSRNIDPKNVFLFNRGKDGTIG